MYCMLTSSAATQRTQRQGSATSSAGDLTEAASDMYTASLAGASSAGRTAALSTEVQQWEVQWEALTILRGIGSGSFGRVRSQQTCPALPCPALPLPAWLS